MAGVKGQNLPEFQSGLSSIAHRWNVSGTYTQVIPRFVSTASDGVHEVREFLRPFYPTSREMYHQIFLKGYQWPLDASKLAGGSSLIDLLVYRETMEQGRRVFLDYRSYPPDFRFQELPEESREYLRRSGVEHVSTPFEALEIMNPMAISMYREHGIDLATEPLEIALCVQHNNGGLAADHWWESGNVSGLFPIGEVSGTHGIRRPGGSALNSGQVGALRAAQRIAWYLSRDRNGRSGFVWDKSVSERTCIDLERWLSRGESSPYDAESEQSEIRERMSRVNPFRAEDALYGALEESRAQWDRIRRNGMRGSPEDVLWTESLCMSQKVYLSAILYSVRSGAGSRGSSPVIASPSKNPASEFTVGNPAMEPFIAHADLPRWRFVPGDPELEESVLETWPLSACPESNGGGTTEEETHRWVRRRPIPRSDLWFEEVWRRQRQRENVGREGESL
ncbi:MAG: FAD-binding protein [Planctomycetia bacterium]|nr:FAD-binding protein [Planctomycetia bacterium]